MSEGEEEDGTGDACLGDGHTPRPRLNYCRKHLRAAVHTEFVGVPRAPASERGAALYCAAVTCRLVAVFCGLGYFECYSPGVLLPYLLGVSALATLVESLPVNQVSCQLKEQAPLPPPEHRAMLRGWARLAPRPGDPPRWSL